MSPQPIFEGGGSSDLRPPSAMGSFPGRREYVLVGSTAASCSRRPGPAPWPPPGSEVARKLFALAWARSRDSVKFGLNLSKNKRVCQKAG